MAIVAVVLSIMLGHAGLFQGLAGHPTAWLNAVSGKVPLFLTVGAKPRWLVPVDSGEHGGVGP
jgi:hypothetical protein